jgi:hypothetical protein
MAETQQDEIYQNFLKVAQQQSSESMQAARSLADVVLQADAVRQDLAQQTARTSANAATSSTSRSTTTKSGGQTSEDNSVLSTVMGVFKGMALSPVIKGILGLFGGDDAPEPAPLVKYALPPSIQFQGAELNGGIASADYDQTGMPRGYSTQTAGAGAANTVAADKGLQQITVNVQAMDARSFLDRSNDIALAVRDAMLNLNAINDVVNDL